MEREVVFTDNYALLLERPMLCIPDGRMVYNGRLFKWGRFMAMNLNNKPRLVLAYLKLNPLVSDMDLPLLPSWNHKYWIGEVTFTDGTVLKTEKFFDYDSGIKLLSSGFSSKYGVSFKSISYKRYELTIPWNSEEVSIDEGEEVIKKLTYPKNFKAEFDSRTSEIKHENNIVLGTWEF